MKNYMLFFLFLVMGFSLRAGDVEFFLDVCRFQDPQNNPYIEVYLTVDGSSVTYEPQGDNFQGSVNIKIKLDKRNTSDTLTVFSDNYNFLFNIADTTEASKRQGQIDLKRIPLEPGNYMVQVIMIDNGGKNASQVANINEFEVTTGNGAFTTSDLEFLSKVTKSDRETPFLKNGYEVIPYGFNAAFINEKKVLFYLELYQADKLFKEDYFIQATFLKDDQPLFMYDFTKKKSPKPFDVVTGEFDITKLPSSSYHLQVKVFNKENPNAKTLRKKIYVFNSEVMPETGDYTKVKTQADAFGIYTEKELNYYIRTLMHNSTQSEIRISKVLKEYEDKKNYIYSFWEKRVTPETDVTILWNSHLASLNYVNDQYKSTFREGWETDRGRVFMMYGIPNDVERFPAESMRLPHEIFKYDRLGTQSQVIFVFLDNDLATSEYPLIHSNKYGELQNYGWQDMLINGDTNFQIDPGNRRDDYEGERRLDGGRRN
ncbi:GWxTD domain-containing protein [bacterium]|nr:GWxTD domain-containing protein [bacterium]